MRNIKAADEQTPVCLGAAPIPKTRHVASRRILAPLLIATMGLVALAVPLLSSHPINKDTDARHSTLNTPPSTEPAIDTDPDAEPCWATVLFVDKPVDDLRGNTLGVALYRLGRR